MLIGEVARRSGVSARMLRHYEAVGLVRPTGRTAGGYRAYSEEDVRRIFHVESLRALGLTLEEVRRALEADGFAPAEVVAELIVQTRRRLAHEEELLERLGRVADAGPGDWDEVLRIVSLLRTLASDQPARRQRAVLSAELGAALSRGVLADALLAESEPNVAGTMRWALARAGPGALAELAAGLASPDPEVRHRALAAVVAVPGERSTGLLLEALADPDARVRHSAALALGARGQAEAVPVLVRMVVEGSADVEAAECLGRLARAGSSGVVAALRAAAGAEPSNEVRRRLAQALAELPGDGAAAALTDLAADEDRAVALTARAVLRQRPAGAG